MDRNSLKLILAAVLMLAGSNAGAQTAYPLFAPATGILKGDVNTFITTAAAGTDLTALFSGACSATKWLRGDASCQLVGDLTRTNDTNVTLTLGGTPVGSLLTSTSLTMGWTGTLAAARGGTGVGALGNLTKADDTNVTLTLGGTPNGALITSASITAGWTGTLAAARGGLGFSTVTDDTIPIANGTLWQSKAVPACTDTGGNHLNYDTATNALSCGTTSSTVSPTGANPTGSIGLTAVNGVATTFLRSDGAPLISQTIAPTWSSRHIFTGGIPSIQVGTAGANLGGNLYVAGSSPFMRIQDTGANGSIVETTVTNAKAGITANFNIAAIPFALNVNGQDRLTIATDGGTFLRNATGSSQGDGTLNAAQLYVNGVVVATSSSGSFTASFDDACTTTPTIAFGYVATGSEVTVRIKSISGFTCTSDSAGFATTGTPVPAAIRPTGNTVYSAILPNCTDNSVAVGCLINITTAGNVTLERVTSTFQSATFTAGGTKGAPFAGIEFTYYLGNP